MIVFLIHDFNELGIIKLGFCVVGNISDV